MSIVKVVPPDPGWGSTFDVEATIVRTALGENVVAVHHIGSTSIPQIYAKPVIDVLLEVKDIDDLGARSEAMESLGYEVMGEFGLPGRRYFRKDDDQGVRTHQIHAYVSGSSELDRHLNFRDFMLAHPELAKEYSELKRRLADQHPDDADAYMDGKDDFIKEMDRRAKLWRSS